ncbi:MAG: phosphatase PAP2 family protein [Agathobacter sp.]|nr:phosphatase PAP2 family protein [Agathobacter sp.]
MKKENYIKMTQPYRDHPRLAKGLHKINSIATGLMYVIAPCLMLYTIFTHGEWLKAILIPGISFVAVSLFRKWVNRPRPYEAFDLPPVIAKDTKGKSFPSRHVFSAFIIAQTAFFVLPWMWVAVVLLIISTLIGCVRVLSGVHYVSDVVAGAVIAILCSLFYLI